MKPMSNIVKVELDSAGIRKNILQSEDMLKYVEQVAESRADADTHIKSFIGFDRAQAIIYSNTKEYPE